MVTAVFGHARERGELERELPFPAVLLLGPESTGKYLLASYLAEYHAGPGDRVGFPVLTAQAAREVARFMRTVPRSQSGSASHKGSVLVKVAAIGLDDAVPAAQHILLKALEEPPPYGRIILSASRLPLLTVASRCVIRRTGLLADGEVAEVLASKGLSPDLAHRLASVAHGQAGPVLEAGGDLGRARQAVAGVVMAAARGDADALARQLRGWGATEDWLLRQMLAAAASGRPDPLFPAALRPRASAARRASGRISGVSQARPLLAVRMAVAALEKETGHG